MYNSKEENMFSSKGTANGIGNKSAPIHHFTGSGGRNLHNSHCTSLLYFQNSELNKGSKAYSRLGRYYGNIVYRGI